jgi:hypothetical protein
MPLQATSGAASYDAFGGGAAAVPQYIEDVFSTWLYKGNSSTQTISNGVDLSGKGGMVWLKVRDATGDNYIRDTARGGDKILVTNSTNATSVTDVYPDGNGLRFDTTGFSLGPGGAQNSSSFNYASWTFRKQPKFFDVVTYTGDSSGMRQIPHSLTSTPGCIIVKRTNGTTDWRVWHRTFGSNPYLLELNTTSALNTGSDAWGFPTTNMNSTSFSVDNRLNDSGATYVAYLFAHDAGGFGLTGADNVISCGSYTGNGSETGPVVTLGYEPQWLMIKRASGGTGNWQIIDNMRGMPLVVADATLQANLSNAESSVNYVSPTATGFQVVSTSSEVNTSGNTYIYIAIRRGPMKVPTTGTSVFAPVTYTGDGTTNRVITTGIVTDLFLGGNRNSSGVGWIADRLRGQALLQTYQTNAEQVSGTMPKFDLMTGVNLFNSNGTAFNASGGAYIRYGIQRAPVFFDQVCYTGTGSNPNTLTHNLSAVPELAIYKRRNSTGDWNLWAGLSAGSYVALSLNGTGASFGTAASAAAAGLTFTTVNPPALGSATNVAGGTYVAYLFATCPGVSKVGSYTGTGTTQTINCGFTAGARFVLIKRTSGTGDWYVWDTARGIVAGNDPHLSLNTTAAEVASNDTIDTDSTGFVVNQVAATNVNVNAATYIFLAIA